MPNHPAPHRAPFLKGSRTQTHTEWRRRQQWRRTRTETSGPLRQTDYSYLLNKNICKDSHHHCALTVSRPRQHLHSSSFITQKKPNLSRGSKNPRTHHQAGKKKTTTHICDLHWKTCCCSEKGGIFSLLFSFMESKLQVNSNKKRHALNVSVCSYRTPVWRINRREPKLSFDPKLPADPNVWMEESDAFEWKSKPVFC